MRINNVIDLPNPVPEEDDDSYNCMNVDFDRYVVAGIFSQDALDKVAEEEELVFPGSKVRVLGPAARKLAQMAIHTRFGHLGHCAGCRLCEAVRKSTRRIYAEFEPFKHSPIGMCWGMDAITWSFPTKGGAKNAYIMGDDGVGYLDCLILVRKSDLPKFFIPKIEEIRNEFQGDHKDHIVFRELQIDGAGEQVSHNIEALLNDVKGGAVETILTDPRRKESAAMIEARVKRSEIGTKTMMLETSMPADEWDYSMLAHIWLSRRVPRQKDIRSRDGDAIRPLEAMSRGRISRATLDHDMSCFPGPPGTPCRLSKTKILGSNVAEAAREEWGVFLKMKGNMPYFKLFKDNKLQYWCHTKDYKVQQLLPGQNYMDFFNIPQTVPKVTLPEPDTGQLIEDNAARIERELQLLHTDPGALIGRDVYMRWIEDGIDTGVVHGVVKDHDNDHDGEHLWGIKWDDSTEHHDFTLINMIPSNCVGGRGLTRGVAIAMAPAAGGSGEERSYPRASGE